MQLDFRPYLRNGDDLIVDAALPMHLIDKHKMLELKRLLIKAGMDFQFGFVKNICCMLIREVNQPGFYKKINTLNQMQKSSHAAPLSTNPGPPLIDLSHYL